MKNITEGLNQYCFDCLACEKSFCVKCTHTVEFGNHVLVDRSRQAIIISAVPFRIRDLNTNQEISKWTTIQLMSSKELKPMKRTVNATAKSPVALVSYEAYRLLEKRVSELELSRAFTTKQIQRLERQILQRYTNIENVEENFRGMAMLELASEPEDDDVHRLTEDEKAECVARICHTNQVEAREWLNRSDGNPIAAIERLEKNQRGMFRLIFLFLIAICTGILSYYIYGLLADYRSNDRNIETEMTWQPLSENPIELPVWAFRINPELQQVLSMQFQMMSGDLESPSTYFCAPTLTNESIPECWSNQRDVLVCENGMESPSCNFSFDPPLCENDAIYGDPLSIDWEFCGRQNTTRVKCPISWPVMVQKKGSASYGDDRGCWKLDVSTAANLGGARVCPDGRIPDLFPTSCTHRIVENTEVFIKEKYAGQTLRIQSSNFMMVLPPNFQVDSNSETYTISFRYHFDRAYETWKKDKTFQSQNEEFFNLIEERNLSIPEIQEAAAQLVEFDGTFTEVTYSELEGKTFQDIALMLDYKRLHVWREGTANLIESIPTVIKGISGSIVQETETTHFSTADTFVNYDVRAATGGLVAFVWSITRMINKIAALDIVIPCHPSICCGRESSLRFCGCNRKTLDKKSREELRWYLKLYHEGEFEKQIVRTLSSRLSVTEAISLQKQAVNS